MMLCKIPAHRHDKESVQIKLLCGSDVLESFAVPGLWTDEDVSCYHCLLLQGCTTQHLRGEGHTPGVGD